MLHGYPTKNGTGISIFGDYGDLRGLYYVVHEIANSLNESIVMLKGQHQLLMEFAFDIRKAYSGQRLTDNKIFNGDDKEVFHYGFQCAWPDILIFISTLRHNTGYIQSDKFHQGILYMLEYVVERALFQYDPVGANSIQHYIGQRINITNQYAYIIYQAIRIKYLQDKPGKKRFRNIPQLIGDHYSEFGQGYKELIADFTLSAKKQNCEIIDLEFGEYPEALW